MAQSLVIRKIRTHELGALLELYQFLGTAHSPPPPTDDLQNQWCALLADPRLHYFVVETEGRIVSTCTLTLVPDLTQAGRPYGVVENVVTHPDFRQRGIGTRLLKGALQFARECGCYKVMMLSASESQAALNLYRRAGFTPGERMGLEAKL